MANDLSLSLKTFTADCADTLTWLGATEALWLNAPPATAVRMNLKVPQMEALYEAAFLRIFTAWEVFQEDACVRMMAGAKTSIYAPSAPPGKAIYRNLGSARQALYGGRRYLLWHDPVASASRVAKHLVSCPLEASLTTQGTWLDNVGKVRHRVAHASKDASDSFEAAALSLTGTTYQGRPGRLLRAQDTSDALNLRRWIVVIVAGLRDTATQICH